MQAPGRPVDDTARLKALQRYDVLDTVPEQALDDLTALAAHICGAPIALISLVDADRQWFKSRFGYSGTETARDVSFCGHAILHPELFIVPDAALDSRFADNPLVTADPHIRFYAGAPLLTAEGQALGTMCIFDRVPRELTSSQQEALRVLARQVMAQFELRRQAQELIESEGRLLKVFHNCPVALAISLWEDRTFVDVNVAFSQLLGWTREEVLGRSNTELHITKVDSASRVRAMLQASPVLRDGELVVQTKAGEHRDVLVGMERLELGGVPHVLTTFVDITARKTAELASNRLAAIVASSGDAIIGKDLGGAVTSWNTGAERIFGYRSDEMVGSSIMRLIPADRLKEEEHILDMIGRGENVEHFETQRRAKDGRLIDVSVAVSPIKDAAGRVCGVSKVARDITERKRLDAARHLAEARYRTLFEYAPDGIVIGDSESYYVDANESICRMLGYTREELIGLHASDIVANSEAVHIKPALGIIHAMSDYHREWTFRRKDGTHFDADVIATKMPDGMLLGMIRDTTERNRSQARLRRLVDSNAQGVMFWNKQGNITDANDAFLQITGYARQDLEADGIDWTAMTPEEYRPLDLRGLAQLAEKGVCAPFEKEYFRKDGRRVPVLVGAAIFEDDAEEGVCFVLDLTERKKLEQQFLRAQRMESVGTLAGGIAHDLNNVLAPILMSIEILNELARNQDDVDLLATLKTSVERGVDLVQQVLSFARGVEGRRVTVNPLQLVRDLLKVMRDTFPRTIDVRFESERKLWALTGDPTQVHQVCLNLCVNARDAMPMGGTLTVSLENVVVDDSYAAMNPEARPGAYVMIKVADTGTGILPEIRDKIFEPFFTTKDLGKGTGLGLSTTIAIVRSHLGFVHVYSEAGSGTTFKVYLPADTSQVAAEQVVIEQAQLPRGQGELVLIVDDEEAIRQVVQNMLERYGYKVLLAANGAEAVALYAQNRERIAVVLTDMAMPVLDGPATIVALKSMNPEVRIIGSSGLASHSAVSRALGSGVAHFVPKPYTAETMLKVLRLVIDE